MKVPELKKLLNERSLPQTGNKADLIARLQEHDNKQAKPADAAASAGQFSPVLSMIVIRPPVLSLAMYENKESVTSPCHNARVSSFRNHTSRSLLYT